jgi:hypothetical protein
VDHLHAVGDARSLGVALRERGELSVVFDADRARAELAGRPDRDLAVAGAEVVDDVLGAHVGELEHRHHQPVERRHPHHVLAGLADQRAEGVVAGAAGGAGGEEGGEQRGECGTAGRGVHGRGGLEGRRMRRPRRGRA